MASEKISPAFKWALFSIIPAVLVVAHYELGLLGSAWNFLNTNFSIGILSAFIGTVGAAGIIFYLGQQQKKRDLLAAINMSIALMAGHTNTLLNFKVQLLKPLAEEKQFILTFANYCMETMRLNQPEPERPIKLPVPQIKRLLQTIHHPSLEFMVAIEKLSPFAEKFPQAIVLAVKAKESMDSLKSILSTWDALIAEMRQHQLAGKTGFLKFFGITPEGDIFDTRVPDTIDNMLKEADAALFYLRLATEELRSRSKEILPEKTLKTLANVGTKDGYEIHMPPRDLIAGWNE